MACPESPSAEDLIAFLMRNDPEHDVLSFTWNDNVSRWDVEEIGNVCRAIQSNTTITNLPINLTSVVADEQLTSQLIGCFQSVVNLQLACPFTRRDEAIDAHVIDTLLHGIIMSKSELKSLETTRSGGSRAIIELCQRYPQLESFALGIGYRSCDVSDEFELAVSLALGKLVALKKVSLCCKDHSLSHVVLALVASPCLEKVEWIVWDDEQQLDSVAKLCTYSRSMKEITVEAYGGKFMAEPFLRQTSFRLETLTLQNFHVAPFLYPLQSTVKSVTLTECHLEPGSLVVLQSFPNLISLKLSGCVYQDDQCESAICTLLRHLPRLQKFESTYLERVSDSEVSALTETNNNSFVSGVAQALRMSPPPSSTSLQQPLHHPSLIQVHPSLRSVTLKLYGELIESNRTPLYFPALRQLMQHVPTLCLYCTEFAYSNLNHLIRGLEESNAVLRHLTLHLEDCRMTDRDYVMFFRTVTSTKLRSFCMDFDGCDQLDENGIGVEVMNLLQNNSTLQTLELYYVNGVIFNLLLDYLLQGLLHNKTLSRILLQQNAVGSMLVSPESTQTLLDVLRLHNTTLQVIEPLKFADDVSHLEHDIAHYLRLNRYGRQFLQSTPPRTALGLWPRIVNRIVRDQAKDILFYFLKTMPSLVRTRRSGIRRPRDAEDEEL